MSLRFHSLRNAYRCPYGYQLAIIYRSRKQFDDEIRILIRATRKFKEDKEFSMRLEKAKAIKATAEMESKTEKESHDPGYNQ